MFDFKKSFLKGVNLFNNKDWYAAHDFFEYIWHNTSGKERITIQAILQIAVAEFHLSNGNYKGATILYGESLGRLRNNLLINLGLDIQELIQVVEMRLLALHTKRELQDIPFPKLILK